MNRNKISQDDRRSLKIEAPLEVLLSSFFFYTLAEELPLFIRPSINVSSPVKTNDKHSAVGSITFVVKRTS